MKSYGDPVQWAKTASRKSSIFLFSSHTPFWLFGFYGAGVLRTGYVAFAPWNLILIRVVASRLKVHLYLLDLNWKEDTNRCRNRSKKRPDHHFVFQPSPSHSKRAPKGRWWTACPGHRRRCRTIASIRTQMPESSARRHLVIVHPLFPPGSGITSQTSVVDCGRSPGTSGLATVKNGEL